MSPFALAPAPTKRLPIGSTARCDCPVAGALVLVLRYDGDDVLVCSCNNAIRFTTSAGRLWPI